MELCNYDLDQLIKNRLNYWFSTEEIYNILGQVVNGYQHLRKYKIIHRDLKPSNLLFKELNNKKLLIKIADFGVGLL
jgi:serine/threonine protein kinase